MNNNAKFKFLKPYIIAEIGVNHAGSMSLAKKMIREISIAGGNAAKFQTYKAEKIASKNHSPYYWDLKSEPSTSQFKLFKKYDSFGEAEYKELSKYCKKNGIDFLSTPFDLDAVDSLCKIMPYFKIASADITNVPLLEKISSKKKPVILSTGASKYHEIDSALEILYKGGVKNITLLHCVLNYPTPKKRAQMSLFNKLKSIYGEMCHIGYSDHVAPNLDGSMPSLEMATLNGAVVIEKHFTHDKTLKGNDHYHAMDKNDLKKFVNKITEYRILFGNGQRNLNWEKRAITSARRRIISSKEIKSGTKLSHNNLIALRSEVGIEVSHWKSVVGKKINKNIKPQEPIHWKYIES